MNDRGSRRMRLTEHKTCLVEKRNAYKSPTGKPERKKSLGIPRLKWMLNNKMNLKDVLSESEYTQDNFAKTLMNIWFHKKSRNFMTS
jgi:hypothetical protein